MQIAGLEIAGDTAVMQLIIRFADEYVKVIEAFHRTVAFAKRSWVKKAGLPSRSLAAPTHCDHVGPPTLCSGVAAPKAFGAGGEGS
jgi:hypothetical protein